MRIFMSRFAIVCLGTALLALTGCGKDFNGFGEMQGWGGYTREFGNIDGYGDKEVGLCSYTGGCMHDSPSQGSYGIGPPSSPGDMGTSHDSGVSSGSDSTNE